MWCSYVSIILSFFYSSILFVVFMSTINSLNFSCKSPIMLTYFLCFVFEQKRRNPNWSHKKVNNNSKFHYYDAECVCIDLILCRLSISFRPIWQSHIMACGVATAAAAVVCSLFLSVFVFVCVCVLYKVFSSFLFIHSFNDSPIATYDRSEWMQLGAHCAFIRSLPHTQPRRVRLVFVFFCYKNILTQPGRMVRKHKRNKLKISTASRLRGLIPICYGF